MYIEFKPGEKHAAKGADRAETPDAFKDCGWVLEKDEVVIDIDELTKEQIQELLKRFNINTQRVWTDRGVHLYFRKPPGFSRGRNGICALAFPIETKTSSSAPNGVTIKRNGVLRTIENDGARELLPWYFSSPKQYASLLGFGEGDGRNNALFAHRQKLDNSPDTEKICRFINEVLFDKPLDDGEFNLTIRDGAGTGQANTEYDQATAMINQYKCVVYQGGIWYWDGTEYVVDYADDQRLRRLIYMRCPGKKTHYVDEIVKQIGMRAPVKDGCEFPIRFRNGFLHEGEFVEYKGFSDFTPYFIDCDYDPNAPVVEDVDRYIDQITSSDPDYRQLLMEVMGYAMVTDPERIRSIGKFFIFRGNGANGKGTLLQILRRIYNSKNCSSLSIKDLNDPRYQVTMIGKLANLGDDVQPDAINNDEMKALKNITTADTVETRRLYHQSESATFTVKLYFTANSDIKSYEKGYGYQRRVMWMPMFNTVEKPDPAFISKMTTPAALAYWIRLIVEGYFRIYANNCLSPCKVVEEYNRQYHIENNHMAMFIDEVGVDAIIGKTPKEVRDLYEDRNDDRMKAYSPRLLNDHLRTMGVGLGKKKLTEGSRRIYMRQADTSQNLFGVTDGGQK